MAAAVIKREDLAKLVAAVRAEGRFFGPVADSDGVSLVELGPDDQIALGYANFTLPVKRLFFAPSEVIGTHGAEGMAEAPVAGEKAVIFGVRPCDAKALLYLDKVFLDETFNDPYYRARRDNSVVISLACAEPLGRCFCTSVGGGPAGREGADLLAFDLGESLLLETVTDKGEAFLKAHAALLAKPAARETAARDAQAAAAEKKVPVVDVSGVTEKLQGCFDSPLWEEMAQPCVGCGVCTFLCPTCHCFGLYDEGGDAAAGRRIRSQDSCQFPSFTLEASGHNPRPGRGERMRQRVMHKFRYSAENFGDLFCVGCGRCIGNCPVNVDIRQTLAEVLK